jgi:hypothetical protein
MIPVSSKVYLKVCPMESRVRLFVENEHGWLSSGLIWITSPGTRKIPWKRLLNYHSEESKDEQYRSVDGGTSKGLG